MILEQVLGDYSMRACGQTNELYLVRKELSSAEVMSEKLKLQRFPGEEIRLGIGKDSWVRKDGEDCIDYPEYVWIVARRIP